METSQEAPTSDEAREEALADRVSARVLALLQPLLAQHSQGASTSQVRSPPQTVSTSLSASRSAELLPVTEQLPKDIFGSPEKDTTQERIPQRPVEVPSRKRKAPLPVVEDDEDSPSSEDGLEDAGDAESSDDEGYTPLLLADKIKLVRKELHHILPCEAPPPPKRQRLGMMAKLLEEKEDVDPPSLLPSQILSGLICL